MGIYYLNNRFDSFYFKVLLIVFFFYGLYLDNFPLLSLLLHLKYIVFITSFSYLFSFFKTFIIYNT